MTEILLWDVFCINDSKFIKYVKSATTPTTCPENNSHQIRTPRKSDLSALIEYGATNDCNIGTKTKILLQQTTNRVLKLPNADDDLIAANTSQTITNKTMNATTNTIQNIGDAEIKLNAQINATKLADGTITNTYLQNTIGTTSSIQSQIDERIVGPASTVAGQLPIFSSVNGKTVIASTISMNDNKLSGVEEVNIKPYIPSTPQIGTSLYMNPTDNNLYTINSNGTKIQITGRKLDCQAVTATYLISTTSTSYVDIPGMTLTTNNTNSNLTYTPPVATNSYINSPNNNNNILSLNTNNNNSSNNTGTDIPDDIIYDALSFDYIISFTCSVAITTASNILIDIILNIGGVDVLHAHKSAIITNNNDMRELTLLCPIGPIPNNTIVKMRWKGSSNNKTKVMLDRSFIIRQVPKNN